MGKPSIPEGAVGQGVEALIARLRAEGVEAARQEAEAMRQSARAEAHAILEEARNEAQGVRAQARAEAQALRRAGEDGLRAAARDVILRLRQEILDRFSDDVRRLVADAMTDPELLRAMILEVAAGARDAAGLSRGEPVSGVLAGAAAFEDLRQDVEGLRSAPATRLMLASVGHVLSEGVTIGALPGREGGLVLRLREGGLEIALTDAAVADILIAHLSPRFRALFEGVIR
jgi:V/A-type H+-transporting ATPase subunit E